MESASRRMSVRGSILSTRVSAMRSTSQCSSLKRPETLLMTRTFQPEVIEFLRIVLIAEREM
jgi:hypothetical protein